MAGSLVKGLHDAAVDQNSGRLRWCALRRRHQHIDTVISEPQGNRPAGEEFEGVSPEGLARLKCQAFQAQRGELWRWAHTEDAVTQVELTRKGQYAGPAGHSDLPHAAPEFPSPTPEQGTVRFDQDLRGIESRSIVNHTSRRCLEHPSLIAGNKVAEQVAHSGQSVDRVIQEPQRKQQHPLAIDLHQVRAFPDVGCGNLCGDGVVGRQQGAQLDPVLQIVTAIEQHSSRFQRVSRSLYRIAAALMDEDERIPDFLHPRGSRDAQDRRHILFPPHQ